MAACAWHDERLTMAWRCGGAIGFNQQYVHASPFFAERARGRRAAAAPGKRLGTN